MKIIIDADACPVSKIAIKIALSYNLKIILVYDTAHNFNFDNENIKCIMVDKGFDSADFIIANKIQKEDILITQDYGLASICLAKGCYTINQNGYLYTDKNIDELLFRRHLGKQLRKNGKNSGKIKKRLPKDDENFKVEFTKIIKKHIEI